MGRLRKTRLTVLAPTNAAFANVPKATLAALARTPAALPRVLRYHGKTVRIEAAKVAVADVMTSNGVVHVIDRILHPPAA